MEMEDQYALSDLRQLMSSSGTRPTNFPPSIPHHHDLFSYRNPYELMMMMPTDSAAPPSSSSPTALPRPSGFDLQASSLADNGGSGRWPRQETLSLLEIRSRLDSKFKEANQKGPLWDQVSRIMAEEHNYQRSGKKCREKFENLYKYYKKTKEGKAGRQDGKNYRFFRQLEALYGETSNGSSLPESSAAPASQEAHQPQKHYCDSLSLSNTSEFETSSSEENDCGSIGVMDDESAEKRRKRSGKCWKVKIKQFIDSQMRKLIDKQEVWLEKMMKTLEQKENERMVREEEWRRQEVSRIDRERGFWAKERAWIEARDAALMEALQKLTGRELREYNSSPDQGLMATENQNHGENQNEDGSEILNNSTVKVEHHEVWPESEISKLIQLRSTMKSRFRQIGSSFSDQEILWEEIANKMAFLGYDRSSIMCREKWESIENFQRKMDLSNKKRKENSRSGGSNISYFQTDSSLYSTTQAGGYCEIKEQSPNSSNVVQDSCFRFLMGEGDQSQAPGLWENYGLKLNNINGGDHS